MPRHATCILLLASRVQCGQRAWRRYLQLTRNAGPQPSKPRVAADLSRLPVRYFLNASAFIPLVCRVVSRDVATGGEITSTGFIYGTRKADGSDEQCVVIAATDAVCPPGGEPANTVTLQFFKETETRNDDLTEVEATYWTHSPSPVGSESRPLPMPIAPDNDNTEGWLMFALYLCPAAKIRGRLLEIYVPPLSTADPAGLANVNLIHHSGAYALIAPRAHPNASCRKYVSLRAQVKDTAPADASFSYELKSIADARGSPVFTDAWELIGVHLGSGCVSVLHAPSYSADVSCSQRCERQRQSSGHSQGYLSTDICVGTENHAKVPLHRHVGCRGGTVYLQYCITSGTCRPTLE